MNDCQVIAVISYQTEEAIEIFNSLNSTGMPLADADIISAELYKKCKEKGKGHDIEFSKRWSEIIKCTNILEDQRKITIDDILNQYMYIIRAKGNEKDTTLPGVRRYFTDINKEPLDDPDRFIADVEKIVSVWQEDESYGELNTLRQILFKFNSNFKFYYATFCFLITKEMRKNRNLLRLY